NYFNDLRLVVSNTGEIVGCWAATTEPGRYYTQNPMNPKGAARIAFGNYVDAWAIGRHHTQDALVQVGNITVHRDLNKDGMRTGDKLDTGSSFGINQHTTSNNPLEIGKWSAGCLVTPSPTSHAKFMQLMRDSGRKYFDTTIIPGDKLFKFAY
ncbi:MAG: peptidoglycan-binding protein, partial [Chroococcidiopsis sp.]